MAAADAIDLKSGATVSGIDFTLVTAPQFHLRGRVINGITGQPAQNINVKLTGGPLLFPSSPNNVFDIGGVPPGNYILVAEENTIMGGMSGVTPVTVTEKDLDNLTVTLVPRTTVRGKVTIEGKTTTAPDVSQYRVVIETASGPYAYADMQVQADGTFRRDDVIARDYRLRVTRGSPGSSVVLYVTESRYGAEDVMKGPVRASSENSDRILEITLSLNTATLDVQVVDGNQLPVPGVPVTAVPDPSRRNRSDFYRTATSDPTGHAHFDSLIPGEYKVFASTVVEAAAWQDPDVIRSYESRGTMILATGGMKQEITVRDLQ
jgi:hypothetical protein